MAAQAQAGDTTAPRWRTPRKLMAALSAVMGVLAGLLIWSNAWMAWSQSADVDDPLAMPPTLSLVWAALLLAGGILALARRSKAILVLGWTLCLGQVLYWTAELLSPSWWTAEGLQMPGFGRLAAEVGRFLAWPVFGLILLLPDWLQRRREKAKTSIGLSE